MKISVIIPIYNVQQYIEECIESVLAQNYKDYEIIAIDDCSEDLSIPILEAALKKSDFPKDRVRIIRHENNRGLSAARNTGIKESQSEFVYFLDSDDVITPDCLEKLAMRSTYKGKFVDMVVGNYQFNGPAIGCPRINVGKQYLSRREYIKEYCKEHIYPMAWNRLIRRSFLIKNALFFEEGLIHEDTLWNFQILQYIGQVGIVQDDTYIYRVRQNSIQSSQDFEKHFKANTYIVGRLSEIMFGCSLRFNKYVYNFVEQEKLRHLYDCHRSGNMHLIRDLYSICRTKPHYRPIIAKLLFGYHEGILRKIRKRDAHYALPFEEGLKVFSQLPYTL